MISKHRHQTATLLRNLEGIAGALEGSRQQLREIDPAVAQRQGGLCAYIAHLERDLEATRAELERRGVTVAA